MNAAARPAVRPVTRAELAWIAAARSRLGTREIPGSASNALIATLWRGAEWIHTLYHPKGAPIDTDLAPWCGAFMRWTVLEANAADALLLPPPPPKWWSARSWDAWGVELARPTYGALLTFTRSGGGHVAWCVGRERSARGWPMAIGGNQSNGVTIQPFDPQRISAVRWPHATTRPALVDLPLLDSSCLTVSTNEA